MLAKARGNILVPIYFSTNDSGYLFHFFQEKNGEFHTCKEFVHS